MFSHTLRKVGLLVDIVVERLSHPSSMLIWSIRLEHHLKVLGSLVALIAVLVLDVHLIVSVRLFQLLVSHHSLLCILLP